MLDARIKVKLEVVKQEMAGMNIDILGISELKWTVMCEFNSDDHYIYYCGQESLKKKWSSPHSQQNSLKCSTWVQSQTQQNDLCSFPRQTTQYHSNPSLCPNYHTRCSRTNTQKDVLFIRGDWNAKVGSQGTPGVTGKFGLGVQNEAG